MIHLGGVPLKYEPRTRKIAYTSKPKESRIVNGRTYVYEEAITAEFALIKAWRADKNGNLMFRCACSRCRSTFQQSSKVPTIFKTIKSTVRRVRLRVTCL